MQLERFIEKEVHDLYWNDDINCARTILLTLSKLFQFSLAQQVLDAGIGMHGAGGYRAQCGLVEGALMFLGVYFSSRGKSEQEIIAICYAFAEEFEKSYTSLSCKDLRPGGFRDDDPPHACEKITNSAILFAYKFVTGVIN